jgi:hypothetical protein
MSIALRTAHERVEESLARSSHRFQLPSIGRKHIFFALMEDLTRDRDPAVKLHLLFEFSIIEKLVRAAGRKDFSACRRWNSEIGAARRTRQATTGLDGHELDALHLPALALMEFKQGHHEKSVALLEDSIHSLMGYLNRGIAPAGAAVVEQKLNILRSMAGRCAPENFERSAVEFVGLVVAKRASGKQSDDALLVDTDDRDVLVAYYLDEAIFKVLDTLSAERLAAFFGALARTSSLWHDSPLIGAAIRLVATHAQHSDRNAAECDASLASGFAHLPFSLAVLVAEILRRHAAVAMPSIETALAAHPGYSRYRASIERSGLIEHERRRELACTN